MKITLLFTAVQLLLLELRMETGCFVTEPGIMQKILGQECVTVGIK